MRTLEASLKNAMIEQFYHFIFKLNTTVYIGEAAQTINIQCCQSTAFQCTQVATGTPITSVSLPVGGSFAMALHEVLPPP